jgi:hypothetical protein
MPKIPTFITSARPTAEVGSVQSNIQIGLNQTIGSALAPVTQQIVDYKVKQKDFENKTEALKLENDFIRDMSKVYDEVNILENEDQAQNILKNKSNILVQKYSNLASNKNSQILFNQYALAEVQKGIFRTSTAVQKNTLLSLDNQVFQKVEKLMTTAMLSKDSLDYKVLEQDIKNTYITNYQGKVSNALLTQMINAVPDKVKTFEAEKMISENPRKTLSMLMNEKEFVGLSSDSRKKLIEKSKIVIAPLIRLEYQDHLAKIAKGKESSFDMNAASLVLPTEQVNVMIAEETLNKDRAANNNVLLNSPLSITDEVADSFIKEGYELHGEIKGQENEMYIKDIVKNKRKALNEDPVGFIKTFDPEIELAYQELESETDPAFIKSKKTSLIEMIIKKQRNLEIPETSIRVATNDEINKIKTTLTDPETSAQDKMNFMMFTQDMYGNENMGKVLNQLTDVKLPLDYITALSTNSVALKKSILSANTQDLKALENLVKEGLPEGEKFNSIKQKIVKEMEGYENVIERQPEGSVNRTEFLQTMRDTIYKAALERIKYEKMSIGDAVKSASKDFLNDYRIPASETYMIPVDVNGKRTNPILLEQKLEAVLLNIENTDYIDKVMGEDGYMHFAQFAGVENLTEEQVRARVLSTIKNNSIVLNNSDMTGAIVYAEFANGTYPIVNAKGQKIEIFFTPTENSKGIMSTELKYPVTGEDIILVDESDGLDYLDYNIIFDENQNIGGESITLGSAVDTVGSLFVSKAEASEVNATVGERIILGDNITNENSKSNLQKFITAVHDIESGKGKNLYNESSTAAGDFQFKMLTGDGDKDGSAFQTGLQRVTNLYEAKNQTVPNWVKEAKEHNDPRKLTYKQQEELFLINLQQQKGTDALIKAMLDGNMEKAMQLYAKYHHTNIKVLNDKTIKNKFKKAYKD